MSKTPIKIALLGYGKMGKTIERLAQAAGHQIVLRISSSNVQELTAENLQRADVAIEFSRPESAFDNIRLCLVNGVPVVSGTTAWLDRLPEARALINEQQGALFYASNYSIGVHIFFAVNRYLAGLMNAQEEYEPSMLEIHHTQKLDAPSGTAITLAEDILQHLQRKTAWISGKQTDPDQLAIESERTDQVPGTHVVRYTSPIDTLTLQHEAHSRDGFARGALQAAQWLIGKQGYFGMSDLLGF